MGADLEALRRRYVEELPQYETLARRVEETLKKELVVAGIRGTVNHRTKDVASLLKKVLRKERDGTLDPGRPAYEQIRDKAGTRILVTYLADVARVDRVVRGLFPAAQTDDKARQLGHAEVGYLGVHYEVTLPVEHLEAEDEVLRDLPCEIQVHTRAQNAWAKVAHELSYKPSQEPEEGQLRMIYRLAPLMEIFDDQAQRAHDTLTSQPGFPEATILSDLEDQFYRFTGRDFDRLLSLEIIHELRPLIEISRERPYGPILAAFIETHRSKLEEIFGRYADDDRHLLLFQPESLLVFEQLERDPFNLSAAWERTLPMELLEPLAAAWGKPIAAAA